MRRKVRLKLCLFFLLSLLFIFIGYRIYLFIYEKDYESLNAYNIEKIGNEMRGKTSLSFAVVGNIRNSMRIFEQRIVPLMKETEVDFMISSGNAVYDGAEGKYRLLYRGLRKLGIPYILAPGKNEVEDFGSKNFYRHFGPFFFSFHIDTAYFIFLDASGMTSWKWQYKWLQDELEKAESFQYRFVFLSRSLLPFPGAEQKGQRFMLDENTSSMLQGIFSKHDITAVISNGYPSFNETVKNGVRYIVSGGGGGLLLEKEEQYQFVKIEISEDGVVARNIRASGRMPFYLENLETVKLYLHSFLYMSLFNMILIISIVGLFILEIYSLILRQEHLYRDFSIGEAELDIASLKVAMFTNNYLPFVGGVPLSINRLFRGLRRLGVTVKIFAPAFKQPWHDPDSDSIIRCPAMFTPRSFNVPIVNIFSRKIEKEFRVFDCDLVHIHHPYWLGKKGLRLARKQGIPVVFTYHTRLERYTHYIPLPGTPIKNLAAHFLIKHFANKCDAIITPTSSTEEYLRNLGVSALIETIPTGIILEDYKRWLPGQILNLRKQYAEKNELLLISVSRLAKEKNLDFLIDAVSKVRKLTGTPFKCLLVGDGPEKTRLTEKVRSTGMQKIIRFIGSLTPEDVIRHYLASDLFVFASTSETQGMVLVEAMAGGCPVVAVRASGVHDVVEDGYNGFKTAESTDSWAKTVSNLLNDRELLKTLSDNSRRYAAAYEVEKITEKITRLYRHVLILNKSQNL